MQCIPAPADAISHPFTVMSHTAASVHRHLGRSGKRKPGLGKSIALDIARGLAFLHTHRIVHMVSHGASTGAARVSWGTASEQTLQDAVQCSFKAVLWGLPNICSSQADCLYSLSDSGV